MAGWTALAAWGMREAAGTQHLDLYRNTEHIVSTIRLLTRDFEPKEHHPCSGFKRNSIIATHMYLKIESITCRQWQFQRAKFGYSVFQNA